MPRKKVQYLHPSASVKVVVYTIDEPYGKGRPGYVLECNDNRNCPGPLQFTEDLWLAMAMPRADWERWLPGFRQRTQKVLSTHQAIATLGTLEE